jgi:glycosyltransferase involved in cell wall biosynthesis
MKIFHCVESYYPAPGGMQEVVKRISELLAAKGHEVYVLTRSHPERKFSELNGVKIISFNIQGNPIEAKSEADKKYVDFLLNEKYDIITFFAAQQWATNLALPILKQIKAKKVNVPTGYSGLYWEEFKDYYERMKAFIHDYDINLYLSNNYRDINFARENKVTKIKIVPNGASYKEFTETPHIDVRKKLGLSPDTFIFLHVGSFNGWKGHNELIKLYAKLKTSKKTALLMIGDNWEMFRLLYLKRRYMWISLFKIYIHPKKKMIAGLFDRTFTVNAFRQADLFVFPSNIECSPIVLFECAAAGLPFLSSDTGNAREIAEWTKGGLIFPTEYNERGFGFIKMNEAEKMMSELVSNDALREEMGKKSHEIWKEKFTWEKIADTYEEIYLNLLNQ